MNYQTYITILTKEYQNYGGYFDVDSKTKQIHDLESKMLLPNFWNSKKDSEATISQLNDLKNKIEKTKNLKNKIESNLEFLDSIKTDMDLEIKKLLEEDVEVIKKKIRIT